jgi:hypothetical protein
VFCLRAQAAQRIRDRGDWHTLAHVEAAWSGQVGGGLAGTKSSDAFATGTRHAWVGFGSLRSGSLHCCSGPYFLGRPDKTPNEFPIFHSFLQLSNQIKLAQYEKGTSRFPKKSKLCMVIEYFKGNNFLVWPNFQIPLDFEL